MSPPFPARSAHFFCPRPGAFFFGEVLMLEGKARPRRYQLSSFEASEPGTTKTRMISQIGATMAAPMAR